MALPKIEESRALSDDELREAIVTTKKQLFELRFQKATRQLETTHQFKHNKHRLAQLMTVESERAIALVEASDIEPDDVDVNSVSDGNEGEE